MVVRMKDIAKDLGVSVVTVSKVLRNHTDIGEQTRQRVLERVKELNYRPNLAARALVTGRTLMIGLVVPDLLHPFFAQVAKGLSRVLRKRGYGVVISSTEEDLALERQEIGKLLSRRVDALVIASTGRGGESYQMVQEQNTPCVLIDRKLDGVEANFVGLDDEQMGRLAAEHLVEQGCRRLAHIRGPELSTGEGRLNGFRDALARHRLVLKEEYIVRGLSADDEADVSGFRAMQQLLALEPKPDGVFCYNDPIAVAAMRASLDAGLRIPADIAFVGCGNVLYSDFLRIPLTSIDQDSAGIGERAAQLALRLLEAKTPPRAKTVLLEPRLIARQSSLRKERE